MSTKAESEKLDAPFQNYSLYARIERLDVVSVLSLTVIKIPSVTRSL